MQGWQPVSLMCSQVWGDSKDSENGDDHRVMLPGSSDRWEMQKQGRDFCSAVRILF